MKQILTAACLAATTLASPALADEQPKLLTMLTAPDAQTQLMAMVLTMNAAQAGAQTQVLLCGPAADMALKDAPASATAPQAPKGMSPQGLMQMIMAKTNTQVQVCAIYLPNKGVGPDALLDGITPAKPPAIAGAMLDENTKIMSF
ncbi:hypothetical protein ACSSNL_10430 [Thalassobius sp. S69A]|uniref:hypothetical protein n=1 Tax=unclassified Thalassovita TaxID=2619711 RepID=UPI000C0E3F4E|nr:hypothetical protein [Paracoccaceae bacterium]MBT24936.1 hypothetical protein [Paracoccaceae bacterium]